MWGIRCFGARGGELRASAAVLFWILKLHALSFFASSALQASIVTVTINLSRRRNRRMVHQSGLPLLEL